MTDSHRKSKKRPTLVEGFNTVPHILEEARQAVDDVTRAAPKQGSGGKKPAAPAGRKDGGGQAKRQKAATRKKAPAASARGKKPRRPPAAPQPPAAPPTPPAAGETAAGGKLGLADCGIRVKHAIPGRIRLRLYKMVHNEAMAAKLPALLASVPGVAAAEASTNTGSLLITYDPGKLAAVKGRQGLAGVMHQFFPGLDTSNLVNIMLSQ
jgi:hypothetical protein